MAPQQKVTKILKEVSKELNTKKFANSKWTIPVPKQSKTFQRTGVSCPSSE
jgi:hypothetical protein